LPRPFGEARWHLGPCHHRWWNIGLPIWPWNEAAKCTMEDRQFPCSCESKIFVSILKINLCCVLLTRQYLLTFENFNFKQHFISYVCFSCLVFMYFS
jgi:hypothetical protein